MLRELNVATPLTAAAVTTPESVPPPGFDPIATVTGPVKPGGVFPMASCPLTLTAASVVPAVVTVGGTVNTRWFTGPGLMSKGTLVAPVSPLVVAASV